MKKNSTAGLTAEKLARLLAISCDPELGAERDHQAQTAGAVLDAYWAGTLIVAAALDSMRMAPGPNPGGRSSCLGEILTDPGANENTITAIQQYAKRMAVQRVSEAERAAATVLYFAAIAHGLVFRDQKCTRLSYGALQTSLGELLDKPWLVPPLVPLLEKARAICRLRATGGTAARTPAQEENGRCPNV